MIGGARVYHIVAVQPNGGIGANGDLLHDSPEDRRFFRDTTKGHVVLMFRKTWDSLPAKGLPGRYTVVVGTNPGQRKVAPGWLTPNLEDALKHASEVAEGSGKFIFVAGGAAAYEATMHLADGAFVTTFAHNATTPADTFYPGVPDHLVKVREFDADTLYPETHDAGTPNFTVSEWTRPPP